MLSAIKDKWGIFAGIAGMTLVIVIYLLFTSFYNSEVRFRKAMELGERYLLEEEYEQAVIAFTEAIEIAKAQPEILYLGEQAEQRLDYIVERGAVAQLQTPDGDMQDAVDWLQQLNCQWVPSAQVFFDAVSLLQQLQSYCAAEDYDTVFAMLSDTSYKDVVSGIMGLDCSMRLIDDETEQMTAIYRMEVDTENFSETSNRTVNNEADELDSEADVIKSENYMVYYGMQQNGIRNGEGIWLAYENQNNYLAEGIWENDVPNGAFETRSWQADLNIDVNYRIIIGTVKQGLWDGQVIWRFERQDEVEEYAPTFQDGIWQILREEDGFSVADENPQGKLLIALAPEKTNGIAGYAEVA